MLNRHSAFVLCLLSFVLGCDRGPGLVPPPVVVTNVVTVTREVVVTNVVTETRTETVTNVVVEKREPERILSARKTAPYVAYAKGMDAAQLRKVLSDSGARVIECEGGAVALAEASDKAVRAAGMVVGVKPLEEADKVAADAGEHVKIVPLSTIDVAALVGAVRALGGEVVQVTTVGSPQVRAKMSYSAIRKLAGRGDVRRIERDDKK